MIRPPLFLQLHLLLLFFLVHWTHTTLDLLVHARYITPLILTLFLQILSSMSLLKSHILIKDCPFSLFNTGTPSPHVPGIYHLPSLRFSFISHGTYLWKTVLSTDYIFHYSCSIFSLRILQLHLPSSRDGV